MGHRRCLREDQVYIRIAFFPEKTSYLSLRKKSEFKKKISKKVSAQLKMTKK